MSEPRGNDAGRFTHRDNIERLLRPRHIAFIGGNSAVEGIEMCEAGGFSGPIWVVNPKHRRVAGRDCFPGVHELPESPDATFVAVPRGPSVEVVGALARRGAGGAVAYAAGFAEAGSEGRALEQDLVEAAGEMALVGPNCFGVLNQLDHVALWGTADIKPTHVARGVAVLSQSGYWLLNIVNNRRSLPVACAISMGNQAVLNVADYMDALLEDPRITAIGLYLENIPDPLAFSRAAAKAHERGVPIVVVKGGSTERGREMVLTHTGALVGSDDLYDALFERLGIVRVPSPAALVESLKMMSVAGIPRGPRVAVLTWSGGDKIIVSDRARALGIDLAPIPESRLDAVAAEMPPFGTLSNPLDHQADVGTHYVGRSPLERRFAAMVESGYDAWMLFNDYQPQELDREEIWDTPARAVMAIKDQVGLPCAVASVFPENMPREAQTRLVASGVAPLQGLDEALIAVSSAIGYGAFRRMRGAEETPGDLALSPSPGRAAGNPVLLDEWDAKQRLAAFGLPIPKGLRANRAELGRCADQIGFPVALKVLSNELAHKSAVGGVALALRSAAAVEEAACDMIQLVEANAPHITVEWFLVETMIERVVAELIIGVKRDDKFGFALGVGAGGVGVASQHERRTVLLPATRAAMRRALESLEIVQRCTEAGASLESVLDAAGAIATFADANRTTLVELDVNPLLVREGGGGVIAADVLARIRS